MCLLCCWLSGKFCLTWFENICCYSTVIGIVHKDKQKTWEIIGFSKQKFQIFVILRWYKAITYISWYFLTKELFD
jgi:hypothetical protein